MSLLMLALMETALPSADTVLAAALRERYPAVVRWEIHGLGGTVPPEGAAASVVRLGSRSAVRAGSHLYWYTVSGYGMAVRATRAISPGESLEATAGEVTETDVLAAACDPLTDASSLHNTRARRALRPDQVICQESIEPRPPVARGDDVTVRYLGERVSITAKATAQSDGAFGEQVLVKSVGTERLFPAVVSGEREVAIHE
jgi:flagella basal body P-ring formation protein FlgA